jgi:hypothetical protein
MINISDCFKKKIFKIVLTCPLKKGFLKKHKSADGIENYEEVIAQPLDQIDLFVDQIEKVEQVSRDLRQRPGHADKKHSSIFLRLFENNKNYH